MVCDICKEPEDIDHIKICEGCGHTMCRKCCMADTEGTPMCNDCQEVRKRIILRRRP